MILVKPKRQPERQTMLNFIRKRRNREIVAAGPQRTAGFWEQLYDMLAAAS